MSSGIYAIENQVNNKLYIGSAVDIMSRFCDHKSLLRRNKHHNAHLQNAWNKYGEESFAFFELEHCNKEDLILKEQEIMDTFNAISEGYNIRPDARNNLGVRWSAEQKKRASLRMKGTIGTRRGHENTPEQNAKISMAHTGKKHSAETRKKIGDASRGRKLSPEHRAALIDANTGSKRTAESRRKMSESQRGRKASLELRQKLSEAHKGKNLKDQHPNWIKGIYRPPCPYCGGDHIRSRGIAWHCVICNRTWRKAYLGLGKNRTEFD